MGVSLRRDRCYPTPIARKRLAFEPLERRDLLAADVVDSWWAEWDLPPVDDWSWNYDDSWGVVDPWAPSGSEFLDNNDWWLSNDYDVTNPVSTPWDSTGSGVEDVGWTLDDSAVTEWIDGPTFEQQFSFGDPFDATNDIAESAGYETFVLESVPVDFSDGSIVEGSGRGDEESVAGIATSSIAPPWGACATDNIPVGDANGGADLSSECDSSTDDQKEEESPQVQTLSPIQESDLTSDISVSSDVVRSSEAVDTGGSAAVEPDPAAGVHDKAESLSFETDVSAPVQSDASAAIPPTTVVDTLVNPTAQAVIPTAALQAVDVSPVGSAVPVADDDAILTVIVQAVEPPCADERSTEAGDSVNQATASLAEVWRPQSSSAVEAIDTNSVAVCVTPSVTVPTRVEEHASVSGGEIMNEVQATQTPSACEAVTDVVGANGTRKHEPGAVVPPVGSSDVIAIMPELALDHFEVKPMAMVPSGRHQATWSAILPQLFWSSTGAIDGMVAGIQADGQIGANRPRPRGRLRPGP